MDNTHFTSIIEEKLKLFDFPEVVQELVVNDLSELILKRVYVEIIASMKEDDEERALSMLETGDFANLYSLLTLEDRNEKIAQNAAEEVIEEFTRQMNAGA